jgi:hypothetical protein
MDGGAGFVSDLQAGRGTIQGNQPGISNLVRFMSDLFCLRLAALTGMG